MKLEEDLDMSINKRKWDNDHSDRKAKRSNWQPKIRCDADVLQILIRDSSSRADQNEVRILTKRGLHASKYPVNCDPIDGISPSHYMMQRYQTSCFRCLQGEPGHISHILDKQSA